MSRYITANIESEVVFVLHFVIQVRFFFPVHYTGTPELLEIKLRFRRNYFLAVKCRGRRYESEEEKRYRGEGKNGCGP